MSTRSAKVIITPEARVLRKLREEAGLSMRAVGELAGWSDSYISQIENGRENKPEGEKLLRLLKIYGTTLTTFKKRLDSEGDQISDVEAIHGLLKKLSKRDLALIKGLIEEMVKRTSS